jgi:GMP synthase (glutamine-hydrolysing)
MTQVRPGTWLLLQHADWEGPGIVGAALEARGVVLRPVRLDLGQPAPTVAQLAGVSGVLAMGGPMNALDDTGFPHLAGERAFLAAAARAGLPVLAICLGAQLLAAGLGAAVTQLPAPEVGVGEVTLTAAGRSDPGFAGADTTLPVVHWHADTFALPTGAVLLAGSDRCAHQAFRWGDRAYGLQFHPELTAAELAAAGPAVPPELADHPVLLPPGAPARARFVEQLVAVLTGPAGCG